MQKWLYSTFFVFSIGCSSFAPSIAAQSPSNLSHVNKQRYLLAKGHRADKIALLIQTQNFPFLGKAIAKHVDKDVSLDQLRKIASQYNCKPLQNAITAAESILKIDKHPGLRVGELVQVALYVETDFQYFINQARNFLNEDQTGTPCAVEYDPKSKNTFIHLGKKIGSGAHKTVKKSILYDRSNPEIVASCHTTLDDKKEMEVIEKLQGNPGIVEGRAFITHTLGLYDKTELEIILKLYNQGSLRHIFGERKLKFTLGEKMQIALNLLQGLNAMHKRNLMHKDLHSGNFLINITDNGKGPRKVKAAICDFGRTLPLKECAGAEAQAFRLYLAPEGFFREKLQNHDYIRTDVYALGCNFYNLFYEMPPLWFNDKYFKYVREDNWKKKKRDQQELLHAIEEGILPRRRYLEGKKFTANLSAPERFEALILRMVNPDPQRRGTTEELLNEMQAIINAT